MKKGIKTIDNLPTSQSKKIASVSDERAAGDGVWIYLNDEYEDTEFDPMNAPTKTIHESGVRACVLRLRRATKVPEAKNPAGEGVEVYGFETKSKYVETLKDIEQDPRVKELLRATPKKGQNTITFAGSMGGKKMVGTAQELCNAINKLS